MRSIIVASFLWVFIILVSAKRELNSLSIQDNVIKALCSDGEVSEGASSLLMKEFDNNPVKVLNIIKEQSATFQVIHPECNKQLAIYLDPKFFNALLTTFQSNYDGHLPDDIKDKLIEFNQSNKDEDLRKFINSLIRL